MQIIYLIIVLLFSCSSKEFPWTNATLLESQSIAANTNKIIMIDFYADW